MSSNNRASRLSGLTIGFFGGGMMAEAIIRGILVKGEVAAPNISVSEPSEPRRKFLSTFGVHTTSDGAEMQERSKVVFIAVKPNIVQYILPAIAGCPGRADKVYVSICAGVTLDTLANGDKTTRIVRVMPNQPCLVGEAASAMAANDACRAGDAATVGSLMGACGTVTQVPEYLLDAVTGLSGSGPAFAFMMMEAMADGGVQNGLPRAIARQLAAQTMLGAAKMMLKEPDVHAAELRNRVESPGGTTIKGTSELEAKGFRNAVISAVTAATQRSIELGKK